MAEKIDILQNASKEQVYKHLLPQIESLIKTESDTIANMANISAVLKHAFDFLWAGFYLVKREQLVLGPFQGNVACTRINFGKGVCGTAWKEKKIVCVPNVNFFDGHIACDSSSMSEIVVPVFFRDEVIAVLDIDSQFENHFDETDITYLEKIIKIFEQTLMN
ncbi:GAF domain-containing protein [Dysgonomonas sp. 216]|uniref:GAF domain-containing protein n=1 Tax=Dysgonomonas sp. 216 TaxID=2302934 RepID=UPI0013D03BF6|nr:GAF domain-containing protein [Dysgonomonas sp. 216]NDW19360.1 GAF domain-containing protein [Dysgonomonas sp. 216]